VGETSGHELATVAGPALEARFPEYPRTYQRGRRWWDERLSYRQKVLDRTVGVEEGGAHGAVNVGASKAHALHVGDGCLTLVAHGQS
jgi:hypothetical protein